MKLQRNLIINKQTYNPVNVDVRLNLSSPARASFTVQKKPTQKGLVQFFLGYNRFKRHTFFTGFIDRITPIDENHTKVFTRELSSVLALDLPIALRNVSLREVLNYVTEKTSLTFILPQKFYVDTKAPDFVSLGSGYLLMDEIANVYQINDYIWQQRKDGKIYVGSWQDSHWAKNQISVAPKLFTKQLANQSATLPIIPAIRPGALINNNRITSVIINDKDMVISWKT